MLFGEIAPGPVIDFYSQRLSVVNTEKPSRKGALVLFEGLFRKRIFLTQRRKVQSAVAFPEGFSWRLCVFA